MTDLQTAGNPIYFYYYDGLGSVAALSNTSGTIAEQYRYDAFGNTKVLDGSGTERSVSQFIGNPYMFTGRRLDPETRATDGSYNGLYYYRARMYCPELGRFLQTDPIGYADGMNMYAYCGNNPVNWIDPWGLQEEEESANESLFERIRSYLNNLWANIRRNHAIRRGAIEEHANIVSGVPLCPYALPKGPPPEGWVPGPGWKPAVNPKANTYNPTTREYLRYDTTHTNEPPHYDYRDEEGNEWRVDPETGVMTPKGC